MTDLNTALKNCTQIEADYLTGKLTISEALHELVWADAPMQVRLDFIDQIAARLIEEESKNT